MVQRGLSDENDAALGDVVESVSRGGRRAIPTITAEELQGKAPVTAKRPANTAAKRPQQNQTQQTPKVPTLKPPASEPPQGEANIIGSDFPKMVPPDAQPAQTDAPAPPMQPQKRPAPPKKPPAPPQRPAPAVRQPPAQPVQAPVSTKPHRAPNPPKETKAPRPPKVQAPPPPAPAIVQSDDMLYDNPGSSGSAKPRKKDKSFTVVASLVSVAIIALLIVATFLLLNTSGILKTVNEYNVVVLTSEVSAGQTIMEEHIGNVILSEKEYNDLTANSFEVTPGGEAIKEVPVPYERREEVVGLIAKGDYTPGTIITNRMVSDQRTITNKYFNVVGANGSQQLEVTIDNETGMVTINVYAVAPNESGESVAVLIGQTTLTADEFVEVLNGNTDLLLERLATTKPPEAAQGPDAFGGTGVADGGEGAQSEPPGDSSDVPDGNEDEGGENDGQ